MYKRVLVLLAVVAMIGGSACPAFAGEPVIKHIGDALVGNNDYIATSGYIAYTVKEDVKIKDIPILPKNLRIKLGTPIGDGAFRTGTLEVGIEM